MDLQADDIPRLFYEYKSKHGKPPKYVFAPPEVRLMRDANAWAFDPFPTIQSGKTYMYGCEWIMWDMKKIMFTDFRYKCDYCDTKDNVILTEYITICACCGAPAREA